MTETLITFIHVGVAIFMILVVLVQGGNQGGMGAAFGGGGGTGGSVLGAQGASSILSKLTYAAAAVFMITSISLTVMQSKKGDIGLSEKLKAGAATELQEAEESKENAPE